MIDTQNSNDMSIEQSVSNVLQNHLDLQQRFLYSALKVSSGGLGWAGESLPSSQEMLRLC